MAYLAARPSMARRVCSDVVAARKSAAVACETTIDRLMLNPGKYVLRGAVCSEKGDGHMLAEAFAPFSVCQNGSPQQKIGMMWNRAAWRFGELSWGD